MYNCQLYKIVIVVIFSIISILHMWNEKLRFQEPIILQNLSDATELAHAKKKKKKKHSCHCKMEVIQNIAMISTTSIIIFF